MIDHISLPVSDLRRSREYYVKALATIGYVLQVDRSDEGVAGLGEPGNPDFWLIGDTSDMPRIHVAFRVTSRKQVDAYFKAATHAGGRDNGGPGLRPHYGQNYYAAFVLDPDGHNIEAVCYEAE
jgi:catechol 2,3-dioxygenase-like lactoylglutathione lyase family enzyme